MRIAHRGGEVTISNSQISVNPSGCHSFIQLVTMFFFFIHNLQTGLYLPLSKKKISPTHFPQWPNNFHCLSSTSKFLVLLPGLQSFFQKVTCLNFKYSLYQEKCKHPIVGDIVPKFVADWRVRLGRASIILRRNRLFSHCYESRVQIVNKYVPDDHLRNSRVSEYSWKIVSFWISWKSLFRGAFS